MNYKRAQHNEIINIHQYEAANIDNAQLKKIEFEN